jgi:uridine kinase
MEEYMAGARPAFDRYIAPTQAYAELVLDGTSSPEELAEALLGWLQAG